MEQWEPRIGEVLPLEKEPSNPEDKFAVAIKRCGSVVGHVPFNLAPVTSAFLKREVNQCPLSSGLPWQVVRLV